MQNHSFTAIRFCEQVVESLPTKVSVEVEELTLNEWQDLRSKSFLTRSFGLLSGKKTVHEYVDTIFSQRRFYFSVLSSKYSWKRPQELKDYEESISLLKTQDLKMKIIRTSKELLSLLSSDSYVLQTTCKIVENNIIEDLRSTALSTKVDKYYSRSSLATVLKPESELSLETRVYQEPKPLLIKQEVSLINHGQVSRESSELTVVNLFSTVIELTKASSTDKVIEILSSDSEGFLIDCVDSHGNSLLHLSCQNNNKRLAKYLINSGVKIDLQNKQGYTALHYSFKYNFIKISEILLGAGSDDTLTTTEGYTCYEISQV